MKITPPNGCILAAYYDNELIFCIGEKWDAKETLEQAIADNTSFENVELMDISDFDENDQSKEIEFSANYGEGEEWQKGILELHPQTLY